ncbi:MAG TPA: phytanoyl-CoA dioxygenase family protein [Candidatus Binatia bacterium]|jgi:ectoine hydroxylase-related dioxygenase (phytanoyl-CoA dioxygenase family)|nr:phytanoyl-CoA dioxygenase family protein [Candidatus Binatia bacterium]
MLAPAAKEQFERHGYVVLPRFFDEADTRAIARFTDEVSSWPETPGRWMRYYERRAGDPSSKLLARIENFVPYHDALAALVTGTRVQELLAGCAGEPVVLFKDKINFKMPGGAGFAPHQDAPAYVDFGVEHHLTLMVPVDPFTPENGCLEMSRWDASRVTLPQNPDGTLQDGVMERWTVEPLLAEPGDVILFDAWVPHRSGPNRTNGPRRSYYLTFNPASAGDHRAAYYARKRECFPPEYEREPGVDYAARGRQFNLGNPFD